MSSGSLLVVDSSVLTVTEGDLASIGGSFEDVGDDDVELTANFGELDIDDDDTWFWSFAAGDGPAASQTVTLTVANAGLRINMSGRALADGAVGQRIKVENLSSGHVAHR